MEHRRSGNWNLSWRESLRKNKLISLLVCICMMLTGCADRLPGSGYRQKASEYTFELLPEEVNISYEVPVSAANVFVDRMGYEINNNKIVIFKGADMPASYTIRSREDGSVVYTGTVKERRMNTANEEYYSYGDFSDFTQKGNYYIQIDKYGESYPFIIHDNLYYSMFMRAFGRLSAMRSGDDNSENGGWQIAKIGENKEVAACRCMYQLLTSYEFFPEVYTDDTGIAESGNDIPDILDECRYEAQWLIHQAQINPDGSGEASGYRAAVLAKYAYLAQNLDSSFYRECLKAAEDAWKSAGKELAALDDLYALASAELYRLTGLAQYRKITEAFLGESALKTAKMSDEDFFAGVVYMKTKNSVDVALCDSLIDKLMNEAEAIALKSKQNAFYICAEKNTVNRAVILQEMLRICVVNHVITNHEYNTVIENHFHYLMGRNLDAVCHASYWEGQEMTVTDILNHPVENASFIFMLSELVSSQISRS